MENFNYLLVGGEFDSEIQSFSPKSTGDTFVITETHNHTEHVWKEVYTVSDYLIPALPNYRVATAEGISDAEVKIAVKNILGY
ncbi:hypothetical protein [Kalamiella sp. sgz302252]|uniref:hypothetical protein n=1 Tax=Pantoea sp. sgz302252 TaxID=3341827 RepID=UPI0036D3DC7D